ncbi:hypothetical protein F5Y15DRAFT_415753 [Xylariaceae sp. FL0016]|nr:hypothetical protein F5Y15DRAFT_415753 [Xylariaceae sp. FL0016]
MSIRRPHSSGSSFAPKYTNHDYAKDHDIALSEFREHRQACERKAFDGRKFVLVNALTARLQDRSSTCTEHYKHDFDRLYKTAFFKQSPEPPSIRLDDLNARFLRVFYILLDVGHSMIRQFMELFHSQGLGDAALPLDESYLMAKVRDHLSPRSPEEPYLGVCRSFCRMQYDWCPLEFELPMASPSVKHILPFYRKERIDPYRKEKSHPDSNATLWAVDVPDELIGPELRKTLDDRLWRNLIVRGESQKVQNDAHQYYRFALKQFRPNRKEAFDREKQIFTSLGQQEGLIQYMGWYSVADNMDQPLMNLVLEFGDFDLYTAISSEAPPVSPSEIKGFWSGMLDISRALEAIHKLSIDGIDYNVWHGDIKPENILRVQERFKLADPGEAQIKLAPNDDEHARTVVTGGTRTYAAPEKAAFMDGIANRPESILQNSDVWSLGCVFSVAATYVILGQQGFLIYDKVRRQNLDSTHTYQDHVVKGSFDYGNKVLKVVTMWHEYLRNLMENPPVNSLSVPVQIEDILQRIDLAAEIQYEESIHDCDRVDSSKVKEAMRLTGFSASQEQLETAIHPHHAPILPTAQRSEQRSKIVENMGVSHGVVFPSHVSASRGEGPSFTLTKDLLRLHTQAPTSSMHGLQNTSQWPSKRPSPLNVWQVQDMLEVMGKAKSLNRFFNPFGDQARPVRGSIKDDELVKYYGKRDIVFLVDNGSSMHSQWSEATFVLRVLVWRSLGYDEDGMELYFTDPSTAAGVSQTTSQTLEGFMREMRKAKPRPPGPNTHQTDITIKLNELFLQYAKDKGNSNKQERPKTIIVLTDGAWEALPSENDIKAFQGCFNLLLDRLGIGGTSPRKSLLEDFSRTRPVTIQFVAFGSNPDRQGRMKRLDDEFENSEYPDFIDMEPSNGDVHKMFLGSLDPKWDSWENDVNTAMSQTLMQSPQSLQSEHSRA